MSTDPDRIWLQNAKDASYTPEGRLWAEDKVWPDDPEDGEPTEYVRADLVAAGRAEARREALEEAARIAESAGDDVAKVMAAGWRGNPNMSGDDRDFMHHAQRRQHDDRAALAVEHIAAAIRAKIGEEKQ